MDRIEREFEIALDVLTGRSAEERRGEIVSLLVAAAQDTFTLRPDEVAILFVSPDGAMLTFAFPPELAAGGSNTFPVSVPSLAGRAVAEGVSICSNQAPEEQHLGFYERVAVQGIRPLPIQKMLAAPLTGPGGEVRGVVEVSRRGGDPAEAGPDFGPEDAPRLERLAALAAAALAR